MKQELTLPQYILLLVLAPPVGAYLICTCSWASTRMKLLAVLYCAAVFLIVLSLRMPAGKIHIDATPIG